MIIDKTEVIVYALCFIALILLLLISHQEIVGESYSHLKTITYDSDETLLHEVCHVVVDNDPEDYFNDNNLKRFCKCQ